MNLHRAALVALLLWPATALAGVVDRVAAVVNEEIVALSEIYELGGTFIEQRCAGEAEEAACRRDAELEVLDTLIMRLLMGQALDKLGLGVSGSDVDRAIDQVIRDNNLESREQLRQLVEREGIPWDAYREQLGDQLRQMHFTEYVIRPRIVITENELVDLYRRSVRDYRGPAVVVLEGVALAVPADADDEAGEAVLEQARQVVAEVREGERTWADVVEAYDTTGRGGQMGRFRQGELHDDLDAVVFAAAEGELAEPVLVGSQVLITRVAERRESDVLPFEDVKDQLRNRLYDEKTADEVERWYQQARRRAAVRVLLDGES